MEDLYNLWLVKHNILNRIEDDRKEITEIKSAIDGMRIVDKDNNEVGLQTVSKENSELFLKWETPPKAITMQSDHFTEQPMKICL